MTDKILLFIPMYNCEKQIPRVLAQLTEKHAAHFAEIMVIDNRSTDASAQAAEETLKTMPWLNARVVMNDENVNLGGSHKVAFNHALENGFDHVAVLHGDDQGSIADLTPHIISGDHHRFDALLGARFAPESKLEGYSTFRTVGNIIFNAGISLVTWRRVLDMGAGLNLYKTSFLKERFYLPFPNNLTFNVYMLYYGIWKKSPFRFFPLTWREDDQVSNAKVFRQAFIILKLTAAYLISATRLFENRENSYSTMRYSFRTLYDTTKNRP